MFDAADMGGGFPDLVVGYRGVTYLLEVKGPGGKLRPSQVSFFARWRGGPVREVKTRDAALAAIGAALTSNCQPPVRASPSSRSPRPTRRVRP